MVARAQRVLLLVAAIVAPRAARAVEPTRLVLTYDARSTSCPDSPTFQANVDTRMHRGHVPWVHDAAQSIEISFTREGKKFRGHMEWKRAGESPLEKDALNTSCNHLGDDLALAAAIVLDTLTARPDRFEAREDTTLAVAAPGVMANDDHHNGVAVLDVDVGHGILTLDPAGSFGYTPDNDWSGSDSFRYHVRENGGQSTPVSVSIEVRPVNDAPVANADSYVRVPATNVFTRAAFEGVLANDTDPDSPHHALRASLLEDVEAGVLALATDGSFTWTAPPDAPLANARFTYQVLDESTFSSAARVTIALPETTPTPTSPPPRLPGGPVAVFVASEGSYASWSGGSYGDDEHYTTTIWGGDVSAGGEKALARGYTLDVLVSGYSASRKDRRDYQDLEIFGRMGRTDALYVRQEIGATALRIAVRREVDDVGVSLGIVGGGVRREGCHHERTKEWQSPLCGDLQRWAALPAFGLRMGPQRGPYASLGVLDGRFLFGELAHLGVGGRLPGDRRGDASFVATPEGAGLRVQLELPVARRWVIMPSAASGIWYDTFTEGGNNFWIRAGFGIGMRDPDAPRQAEGMTR